MKNEGKTSLDRDGRLIKKGEKVIGYSHIWEEIYVFRIKYIFKDGAVEAEDGKMYHPQNVLKISAIFPRVKISRLFK